jgi:sugar phosphate isomerase/epimerase
MDALASPAARGDAVVSAHIWDNVAEADLAQAEASLLRWLSECRRTGVSDLVVHGGSYPDQREGIARTRRVFGRVLPAFERAGVVLNLENHYAYDYRGCQELFSEPWEFLEVLRLNSPSLRFCFDTGHANMTRNSAALLGELAPWLGYVHLADNHGVDDDHIGYGQGTVDWNGIFSRLQAHRYDGVLCVEFPVRDDRMPFRACIDEIGRRWAGPRDEGRTPGAP